MASRGCRDKYINPKAVLTQQLHTDSLIKQLDTLRSQLYVALGSPFQLLLTTDIDERDGYAWGGAYIIWQEDKQAELIGYESLNIDLDYKISVYKQVLDKLIPGVIQLQLSLGNVIYIEEYKKRKRNKKKVVSIFSNVIQLKLMLGA